MSKFENTIKLKYIFQFNSFSCQRSLSLLMNYWINLFFFRIVNTWTKILYRLHNFVIITNNNHHWRVWCVDRKHSKRPITSNQAWPILPNMKKIMVMWLTSSTLCFALVVTMSLPKSLSGNISWGMGQSMTELHLGWGGGGGGGMAPKILKN